MIGFVISQDEAELVRKIWTGKSKRVPFVEGPVLNLPTGYGSKMASRLLSMEVDGDERVAADRLLQRLAARFGKELLSKPSKETETPVDNPVEVEHIETNSDAETQS